MSSLGSRRLSRVLLLLASAMLASSLAGRSFTAIDIGTNGSPRGYWEFLPTAYIDNPTQDFPVVIFFHGLGEGGNGTSDLHEVLGNGPPEICNTPSHPLYNLFEDEEVIMLAPQVTNNTWWNENHIRPFLNFVVEHYRIDQRRIYFTGLSAGSSGIHEFLNDDPNADQITAAMTVAVRGSVNDTTGAAAASGVPYWALTAIGDASNTATNSVDRIAAGISGQPSDVRANYPTGTNQNQTASFNVATGTWTWTQGVLPFVPGEPHPKLTLYPGGSHNSWDRTYNNPDCWEWLFAQVKPGIVLAEDSMDRVIQSGQSITLEATVFDENGAPASASGLNWNSNLAGSLGSGDSVTVGNLGIGVHAISATVLDDQYRRNTQQTTVTILRSGAYRALFDFGHSDYTTAGNWNHLTDQVDDILPNAIADDGSITGVSAAIISRFDGIQTGGVLASDIYPETAQRDTMFVSANYPEAVVQFSGLNSNQTYQITIFASRTASNDRVGIYTINGASQTLNARNNANQTITFNNVYCTPQGELELSVVRQSGSTWAYLGVVELQTDGVAADDDLMGNLWELEQFGNLLQEPDGDFDADGISNELEYAQGSMANDASSRAAPTMTSADAGSAPNFQFAFRRLANEPNLAYQVMGSSDLIGWTPLDSEDYDISITPVPLSDPATESVVLTPKNSPPPYPFLRLDVSVRD